MWQTASDILSKVSALIIGQQSAAAYLLSTAIVGAVGAYFGARAAQRIVSREAIFNQRRDAILASNAAQSLTMVVFNQAAALKKQHHLPMLDRWRAQREAVLAAQQDKSKEVVVAVHFQTPPPIMFPINTLADIVYGKLSLNGRPLAALSELVQAAHTMTHLIAEHEALRLEFEGRDKDDAATRYLALDTPLGRDDRYKDLAEGFVSALDDLIFFSDVLGKDLQEFGQAVTDGSTRWDRKRLPQVNKPGQLLPENQYLIPKHEYHARWFDSHKMVRPPRKVSILRRMWPVGGRST